MVATGTEAVVERLRTIEAALISAAADSSRVTDSYREVSQRAQQASAAHSQSWFGDHALTYFRDFEPPPAGASFDVEWGFVDNILQEQNRGWRIYTMDAINKQIYGPNEKEVAARLKSDEAAARERFEALIESTVDVLSLLKSSNEPLQSVKLAISALKAADPTVLLNAELEAAPRMSRDAGQMMKGRIAPQHVVAQAYLHSVRQNGERALRLASQIRRIIGIVEMTSASSETSQALNRVFVGHGQDPHWRELWDFISTRLHLSAEEFNSISAAGLPTTDRLKEMLERSNFAFLVFTAEDEHADETMHARENVIHEAGLFQGRLGFRRAIVVLEEGCAEFSNLTGLGQIRFPPRSNLSLF